jgi:hypothetical protein
MQLHLNDGFHASRNAMQFVEAFSPGSSVLLLCGALSVLVSTATQKKTMLLIGKWFELSGAGNNPSRPSSPSCVQGRDPSMM